MNNTNNALETLVQRDKQIKKANDKLKASINELNAELETTTNALSTHASNTDIHTPITDIENMVDTKISGLVNSAPETLDTLKELSDALGNDPNFATTVANQIGNKASKDSVYTKEETNTLLEDKANSVHSHVVSDITDFPTIPTKTSDLINDSGFLTSSDGLITSVSWSDINDKPNFSTVATSGSYTDLSNTPTIPTKVSQLENDTGFINALTDVVDTKSNQTINGVKTFNNSIVQKQDGYISNGNIDITTIPSSNLFTHFFFSDKNNIGAAFIRYAQRTNGFNEINLFVRDKDLNNYGVSLNTNNEFLPVLNNTYSLGSSGLKWKKVYSNDVVHTSGDEYVDGNKVFRNSITVYNTLYRRNNNADVTVTPTSAVSSSFVFLDKNSKILGYIEHIQRTSGVNNIGIYVADKNSRFHGIQITSNNEVLPVSNNTYNLGSSSTKWLSVYATTYYGNLVGSITLNQTSLKMTVKDSNSETTRTNDVILANSSNTDYGINAAFGGASNTVVGAGESRTSQLNDLLGNSSENLYLVADGNICFKTGANTYANAKVITLNSSAELSGLAKVIATSFVGALTGNVTGNCSGSSSSCTGNSASATKASYLDNYSVPSMNKIYLDWDKQVTGYVGLKVDNTTMGGLITTKNIGSQAANSATYSTTPATTDNSTRIATTAWVRTYVNSVAGSGSVGASISAYYSNATTLTAEGNSSSSGGFYPSDYSDYINISPTVGTIYTGSQLFGTLNASASGSKYSYSTSGSTVYQTTAKATATFSGAFSSSAKYLCTTANAVKFRAFVSQGTTSNIGTASVSDNSSAKSIFIRVQ